MSGSLDRVKRAVRARRRVELELRSALVAARADGVSFGELGRVLGVSRQAVRQLVCRFDSKEGL